MNLKGHRLPCLDLTTRGHMHATEALRERDDISVLFKTQLMLGGDIPKVGDALHSIKFSAVQPSITLQKMGVTYATWKDVDEIIFIGGLPLWGALSWSIDIPKVEVSAVFSIVPRDLFYDALLRLPGCVKMDNTVLFTTYDNVIRLNEVPDSDIAELVKFTIKPNDYLDIAKYFDDAKKVQIINDLAERAPFEVFANALDRLRVYSSDTVRILDEGLFLKTMLLERCAYQGKVSEIH